MTARSLGLMDWGLDSDDDGHRTYHVQFKVQTNNPFDGPVIVWSCPGLPKVGDGWFFGEDELDTYAFCTPYVKVKTLLSGEPNFHWLVDFQFTTKSLDRCQLVKYRSPFSEIPEIRGTFNRDRREQNRDRYGKIVTFSSMEPIHGEKATFDESHPTLNISVNRPNLPLTRYSTYVDTVNDGTLWGYAARKIKLSNVTWERLVYGLCQYYYRTTFEFEMSSKGQGFDRKIMDEGTRELKEFITTPTMTDPLTGKPYNKDLRNFVSVIDDKGNLMKVPLDGQGRRLRVEDSGADPPIFYMVDFEYYPMSNFLLLGVPSEIGAV